MRHLHVVSEAAAPYAVAGGALASARTRVVAAVDELVAVDLAAADEPAIRDTLHEVQTQIRRLEAHRTALADQLTRRQARRLDPERPDSRTARQRAERDIQHELADQLNITPSEAKNAVQAGGALDGLSVATRRAFTNGAITNRHVRTLRETVRGLLGIVDRHQLEAELVEVAREKNVTDFGRHCRALVARHCAEQAQRDLDRLHRRRYGNLAQDPDGMSHLRAGWAGAQAEVVQTAIEVFRDKDQPGDFRSTEQRTADAIFNALSHALRHAESTDHGNRPHVLVHVDADQLDDPDRGVAETTFTGTLPLTELRPLLDDAVITRIVRDADGQVIDVGRATRNVPGPVWRGLVARDRGCTLCGAPPQRCQGAHIDRRWRQQAGVSIRELGLLCWTCHRRVDAANLTGRLENNAVTWYRPDGRAHQRFERGAGSRGRPPDRRP